MDSVFSSASRASLVTAAPVSAVSVSVVGGGHHFVIGVAECRKQSNTRHCTRKYCHSPPTFLRTPHKFPLNPKP